MRRLASSPIPLILLLAGCSTLPEKEFSEEAPIPVLYEPVLTEEGDLPEAQLPLPRISFSLYTLPEGDGVSLSAPPELPLPAYSAPEEKETRSTGGISQDDNATIATPGKFPDTGTTGTRGDGAKATPISDPPVEVPAPIAAEEEKSAGPVPLRKEEVLNAGETGIVELDGTDWIFLEVTEGSSLDYKDRASLNGKTLFTYNIPGEGTWILLFQRQDHSTGDTELAEVKVVAVTAPPVDEPEDSSTAPEESSPGETESSDESPEEATSVLQAEDRLREIEDNPDRVEETLTLLEYLMDAASDDESLAGYYYRMARTLEMNSRYQDLKKAYETYQYIENTFFLTDYYEKALERIRFLDRHFFKLR